MLKNKINKELDDIKKNNLYRSFKNFYNDKYVDNLENNEKISKNFSSNDYLGLSNNREILNVIKDALKYGSGSTGSRLTSGNINHEELEKTISKFKDTESSLVYSSGYATNLGVISALCAKKDLILSDSLNHASIIDGCKLSKAEKIIYPHRDVEFIKKILEDEKFISQFENVFIITDGVFSMDGDIAPIDKLFKLCNDFNCTLIVDDAHGTGVLGKKGKGTLKHFKIKANENVIQIGTLSKANGLLGGYVASYSEMIDYLINKSRSFIYSTSLPPYVITGAIKSFELIENKDYVSKLQKNVKIANKIFSGLSYGINTYNFEDNYNKHETPIYPLIFGNETMKMSKYLDNLGYQCIGIRYPTVARGSERIRVSITSCHKKEDFINLKEEIDNYVKTHI
ncbi:aminotransferase class I/II-fold pyridoxal phosphate-dependent enzyme [Methanococcus voltae]|uniref:8-amino-7-oxononanoate synthase n=1 Tax=Methanococcus voltae (strain ATCC BAA-1334 / A3) TaxID=456320 RepID=D7DUJ1_METV3|nr:pyridoxal phosphate-dependent aminotransferase family protein [Methanococcus voltae]MCS3900601.1 8-amino-7-oxononanoate synthase [Methanococcus voltae]